MATGRYWAHEDYGLDNPPDMVTFSKKLQVAGIYIKNETIYGVKNAYLANPLCKRGLVAKHTSTSWDKSKK